MRGLKLRDTSGNVAAFLACDEEASFLDLLCEDGFLTAEELSEEDHVPNRTWKLIRRAFARGFSAAGRDVCCADAFTLIVKRLDVLRAWTDMVDECVYLRAPPRYACV